MSSSRTQVYLDDEQRRRVDAIADAEGVSMAEVVRRAVASYVADVVVDATEALTATFGSIPEAGTPSRDEWDRG